MSTIEIGQLWSDKDKRRNRTVEVLAIEDGVAQVIDREKGKISLIQADRFEKRWELVGGDKPEDDEPEDTAEPKKVYVRGNREAWLEKAAGLLKRYIFTPSGHQVPEIRVSVGWPGGRGKKQGVVGQCFATKVSGDEVAQIFISPVVETSYDAIETLAHEIVHAIDDCKSGHKKDFIEVARSIGFDAPWKSTPASPELRERLEMVLEKLSEYPHAPIKLADQPSPQKTYMALVTSEDCDVCGGSGYKLRMTQKWVDEVGVPMCPHGVEMTLAE